MRYISSYGVKRAGVIMFFDESLTVNIWKITQIKVGIEGAGLNLGPV